MHSSSLGSRTMQIRNALPPWEFLLSASRNSLQSYELSRLGHAANLRKEVAPMLDQWVEEIAAAMLARWVMEHREREIAAASDRDHAPHSEGAALRPIISSRIPRRRTTLRAPPREFSLEVERFAASSGSRLAARRSTPCLRSCVCCTEAKMEERIAPERPSTQCAPNHISRRCISPLANALNMFPSRPSPTPSRHFPRLLSCRLCISYENQREAHQCASAKHK